MENTKSHDAGGSKLRAERQRVNRKFERIQEPSYRRKTFPGLGGIRKGHRFCWAEKERGQSVDVPA